MLLKQYLNSMCRRSISLTHFHNFSACIGRKFASWSFIDSITFKRCLNSISCSFHLKTHFRHSIGSAEEKLAIWNSTSVQRWNHKAWLDNYESWTRSTRTIDVESFSIAIEPTIDEGCARWVVPLWIARCRVRAMIRLVLKAPLNLRVTFLLITSANDDGCETAAEGGTQRIH